MFARALRGLRQQISTQVLSVATVALALFCLACALLVLENAGAMARRWGAPVRVTVFLAEGATADNVDALRTALAALPEVREARYVSPAEARSALGQGGDRTIASAPVELFPATVELTLVPSAVSATRVAAVADRVRRLPMVAEVETYRGFTERLRGLLLGGRAAALVMALGVLLCVFAVVSNTVRMSLSARLREIEVLRLVGATPRYVRTPFLLEGAMLGGAGALVALVVLTVVFMGLRGRFESSLGAVLGLHPVFLSWWVLVGLLAGGGGLGAMGSAFALRKGLERA
ncbi:MAG: permease-like cell division protein FtsX [Polyangiales bacterium]